MQLQYSDVNSRKAYLKSYVFKNYLKVPNEGARQISDGRSLQRWEVTAEKAVTHALVTSRIDYCNALYVGLLLKTVRRLQLVQNRAARLVSVGLLGDISSQF